eukprot:CAMPEP_0115726632 /NCGR_PEP_ID=MMETSP0272-20121206/81986_1 /TAXON_ID=71861 /ORGANISM="Scrippsiella trochoidea, Strain CCMP3099" /LENGTH=479 /DNA_ID=CAMNT_0003170077 /DNA_START=57 /DNA_END=1496 /DNA_ORIENTATION=+
MGTKANLTGLLRVYWSLLLGNIVEWYEYAVYGYLAVYLEHHFFQGSEVATWLGFAVTFLARPLGGVVLGSIGDTYGRGFSVNLSIVGMLLGTCGQGLLPTYSSGNNVLGTIGLIVLVILRFVQGLSAAGEISTISTYLTEVGEKKSLGRSISLVSITANLGFLLAKGVVWLVTLVCGVENVKSWAWRLPFILALIPGLIAVWGRQYVPESEEFVQEQRKQSTRESTADPVDSVGVENSHHPDVEADSGTVVRRETTVSRVQSVFSSHWASMLIGVGSVASFAILQYGGFVWTQSFLAHHGMTRDNRMLVGLCARLLMIVLAVPVGWLADVKGVGFVTFIGAGGLAVTAVPLWWMLQSNPTSLETVLLTLGIGFALNGAMVGTVRPSPQLGFGEVDPTGSRHSAGARRIHHFGDGARRSGLRLQRQEKLRMAHVRAEPYFSKAYDKGTGGPCGLSESESDTTTGTSSESMNADSSGDELS